MSIFHLMVAGFTVFSLRCFAEPQGCISWWLQSSTCHWCRFSWSFGSYEDSQGFGWPVSIFARQVVDWETDMVPGKGHTHYRSTPKVLYPWEKSLTLLYMLFFQQFLPNLSTKMKSGLQPTISIVSWNSQYEKASYCSVNNIVFFATENGEEQLKKPCS